MRLSGDIKKIIAFIIAMALIIGLVHIPSIRANASGEGVASETDAARDIDTSDEDVTETSDTSDKDITDTKDASDEDEKSDDDEPDDKDDSDLVAFDEQVTVDGTKIRVTADEGVFPEGATLSAKKVSDSDAADEGVTAAVEDERDDEKHVAISMTFDITVFDADGHEIEPDTNKGEVKVSFTNDKVADSNLDTDIYHIEETNDGAVAKELTDVEESGSTATAVTDGFSYYTVEFTYGHLGYSLDGDSSVELSEILSKVGLSGNVSSVEVSDDTLFKADKENGKWIVTAINAFSSDEWMKVTIGGVVYEITVTDAVSWTNVTSLKDGRYEIIFARDTSYSLDLEGGYVSDGAAVRIWKKNNTKPQRWILKKVGSYYQIISYNTRTMSNYGTVALDGSMSSGTKFNQKLSAEHSTALSGKEIFMISSVSGSGTGYYLRTGTTGSSLVATIPDTYDEGTDLQLASYNASKNQRWLFSPKTFTINYNKNGGTGTMSSETVMFDSGSHKLKKNTFTKTNYIFTGWNTKADGSGSPYSDEESYTNLTTEEGGSVTLYAQWRKPQTIVANDITLKYGDTGVFVDAMVTKPTSGGGSVYYYVLTGRDVVQVGTSTGEIKALKKGFAVVRAVVRSTSEYAQASVEINVTVNPADVTVSAVAKSKTYGAADPALTATVTGLVGNDDETKISYTISRAAGENVGTYTITPTGNASQGNYQVNYVTNTFTIKPATVIVTAADKSKGYKEADPEFKATIAGLKNSDQPSVINYTLSRVEGEDVGTYDITPAGAASQGNYKVTFKKGTFTITPASVTVTADDCSKKYGDADPSFTATVTGLKPGDSESDLSYTFSRAEGEDVGEYAITPTGDAVQGNYSVTYATGKLTIDKATATVTADDKSKGYNDDDPELTATVTGLKNGDSASLISYDLSRAEGENVGSYAITPTGDAVQGNYNVEFVNGTFTITQSSVKVTAVAASKVYGDADPEFTATVTGVTGGGSIDYQLIRTEGEDAGTYTITPVGDVIQGGYSIVYVPAKFTITPAPVTVKADEASKTYGDADPEFTATVTGLKNGDAASVITYSVGRKAGEESENVGARTIIPAGDTVQGNYTVSYEEDILTINCADVTVKADDKSRVFGGIDPELTATVTGLKGDDTVSVLNYTLTRAPGTVVGTYEINVSGNFTQGNYRVSYKKGTFTITAGTVTVTANDASKVYGEADPQFTAKVTGLNGNEQIDYTWTRTEGEDVGTYTLTPTGAAVQGNYSIIYVPAEFKITPATATVTAVEKSKTYGENDPVLTATVSGLKNNDTASVIDYTLSRANGETVGSYTITPTGAAAQGNYDVTYVTNILTIEKAHVTIKMDSLSKEYGESDPEMTYGIEGLQFSDNISITPMRVPGENVGQYAISITDASRNQQNYEVNCEIGYLEITRATATITPNAGSKVYGDAEPELTATISGIKKNNDILTFNMYRDAGEDAGTYTITAGGADTQGNYNVIYNTGVFTINPATLLIEIDDASKEYGEEDPEFTATVTGFKGEDDEESVIDYTLGRAEGENVGSYDITPLVDRLSSNYVLPEASGKLTINRAPVTVIAEDKSKRYGDADPEFTATVTGLVNGEDESLISYTISRAKGEIPGIYEITPTGKRNQGNYSVSYDPAILTIKAEENVATFGIKVGEGVGPFTIDKTDEEMLDLVLTDEDKAMVKAGAIVSVYFEVNLAELSDAEKTMLLAEAGDSYELGAAYDIRLFKKFKNQEAEEVHEIASPVTFTFELSDDMFTVPEGYTREYKAVTIHENVPKTLDSSFDTVAKKGAFGADRFSIFAFAYKDEIIPDKNSGNDNDGKSGSKTDPKPEKKPAAPKKTADESPVIPMAVLLVMSFAGIMITVRRKKHETK